MSGFDSDEEDDSPVVANPTSMQATQPSGRSYELKRGEHGNERRQDGDQAYTFAELQDHGLQLKFRGGANPGILVGVDDCARGHLHGSVFEKGEEGQHVKRPHDVMFLVDDKTIANKPTLRDL